MSTSFQGSYTPFLCSSISQSVTRTVNEQSTAPINITTYENYTRVYTATFTIVSSLPSSISIGTTAPGINFQRVGDVITASSANISSTGVEINNLAYFKLFLRNIKILTVGTSWPSPASTINVSISDGTTNFTGVFTISSLSSIVPTAPVLSLSGRNTTTNTLTWTASTQSPGPGIAGYYIFKNGDYSSPYATTTALTYSIIVAPGEENYYEVQAYDLSVSGVTSPLSNIVGFKVVLNNTTATLTTSSNFTTWTSIPTAFGGFYRLTEFNNKKILVPINGSPPMLLNSDTGTATAFTATGSMSGVTGENSRACFKANNRLIIGNSFYSGSPTQTSTYSMSTDGTTWTSYTLPFSSRWVFGGGGNIFSASSQTSGTTYYISSDGINWTSQTGPSLVKVFGLTGAYLTYDSGNYYSSATCTTGSWAVVSFPHTPASNMAVVNNIIFTGSSATTNIIMTSTNASTWTVRSVSFSTPAIISIVPVYTNSKYFLQSSNEIAISNDGMTWSVSTMTGTFPSGISDMIYCFGQYLVSDATYIYKSVDGINWSRTAHGLPPLVAGLKTTL